MLVVETVAKIRRDHDRGKSIKAIVREMGLSRNTIRKAVRAESAQFSYRRSAKSRPELGGFAERLDGFLEANERAGKRDRLRLSLTLPPSAKIYLSLEPCDMHKGFDGLSALGQRLRPPGEGSLVAQNPAGVRAHPQRNWGQRFWPHGYFSTTSGNITDDIIMRYLDRHTHKDGFSPAP